MDNNIDNLLKDVKDKFWRDKIKRSIQTVLNLYSLSLSKVLISRQKISPDELYIAATEECNLETAKKHFREHSTVPPPITVIQYKDKKTLFMGSNRAIQFVLHRKFPDCIVIKIPGYIESKIVSEAKSTLKEIIEKQK